MGLRVVFVLPLVMTLGCAAGLGSADRSMHDDLEQVREQSDMRQANHERELPPEPKVAEPPVRRSAAPPREVIRIGARDAASPRVDDPGPRPVIKVVGGRRGGGTAEARNLDDEGLDVSKASAEELALLKKADDALRAGKNKEALEAYGKILVARPEGPLAEQAMLGRAVAHQADGDQGKASEDLEALLTRFPASETTPDVLARLIALHRTLGHRERAADLADRLRSTYPKSEAARRLAREDSR
jgi:TolA-binding protein